MVSDVSIGARPVFFKGIVEGQAGVDTRVSLAPDYRSRGYGRNKP